VSFYALHSGSSEEFFLGVEHSGVASPKFRGAKMFDFRRPTVFLFGTPFPKAQND